MPVPLPWGCAWLGITLMQPSLLWLSFYFYFGVSALGLVRYRFLHMVEVLLVVPCLMLLVCLGGGIQLCFVNNAEEVLFSLYIYISKLRADPRHHNNWLRHPGCLMWAFFFSS